MDRIRVLIADDHTFVRQALRVLLHGAGGIEVIGEARDGQEAVDETERLTPDVVLMDVMMPRVDGAEATKKIILRWPEIKIVALSGHEIDERIFAVLRAGALGYVSKTASLEEIIHAIRKVAAGKASMPAEMTIRLLERLQPEAPPSSSLSEFEAEILRLVAKGQSNREISGRLNISAANVRTHLSNILGKLAVTNRVEATLRALRDGVTTLEECLEPEG